MTFYFSVALINAEGQEGLASGLITVNVAAAMQARVSLSNPPANAQGWNVCGKWAGGIDAAEQRGDSSFRSVDTA